MMSVVFNDRGPLVVTMQVLLNRHGEGSPIKVDGHFGPLTREAVRQFQHMAKQPVTGDIDDNTWNALSARASVCAIDAVDIYDTESMLAPTKARAAGPGLITTGGASNGVASVVARIVERSSSIGRIAVLRFIGHGGYGAMAVSGGSRTLRDSEGKTLYRWMGRGSMGPFGMEHSSYAVIRGRGKHKEAINPVGFDPWLERAVLGLRPRGKNDSEHIFAAESEVELELRKVKTVLETYAVIELHGCMTGNGRRGEISLSRMADIIGVPVAAGSSFQKWGHRDNPWEESDVAPRLEPPIRYFYPNGTSPSAWARSFSV
jgi:hypothetical protein